MFNWIKLYVIQKNNLFNFFDFAKNWKINLYIFAKAHILHLLILKIILLKSIASIIVISSTIWTKYSMISLFE